MAMKNLSIYNKKLLSELAQLVSLDKREVDAQALLYIEQEYKSPYENYGLNCIVDKTRIEKALLFWKKDIEKLHDDIGSTPRHFKQCGHLCYWLRRQAPIQRVYPKQSVLQTHGKEYFQEFSDVETDRSILLLLYHNEFMAFDTGLKICRSYEARRHQKEVKLNYDTHYLKVACQFLQEKNVSPHALTLIYKSLFIDRT